MKNNKSYGQVLYEWGRTDEKDLKQFFPQDTIEKITLALQSQFLKEEIGEDYSFDDQKFFKMLNYLFYKMKEDPFDSVRFCIGEIESFQIQVRITKNMRDFVPSIDKFKCISEIKDNDEF